MNDACVCTTPHGRRGLILLLILALALGGGIGLGRGPLAPAGRATPQQIRQLYICSMHPQVVQDHPGDCPICGMALSPVREILATPASGAIAIDPVTIQNMGLRTGLVRKGPLRRTIRTVATVAYDETSLAEVSTKFRGWIEKMSVSAVGQQVHRGDPLFEIYSPDLLSAQAEYLVALDNRSSNLPGLPASAAVKLRFFDISDDQIAELQKTRQPHKTLRINAPRDGTVVLKNAVEGQMVEAGQSIYRIADLGLVWVQAQVFEQDMPFLRLGQEAQVTLSYLPDRRFRGRVTFIYPAVDEKTRTVQVRMEFHNPGYFLKPGMFATVELTAELAADALLVPDSAVLRSGARDTVFVARDGGTFEPRTVTLGPRGADDCFQVLRGLAEGERVVASGQFLLDSESQLREALVKMTPVAQLPTGAQPVVSSPAGAAAAFVCPMPEHVAILYQQPGKCPLCGMALVPVTAEQLAQIQPGGIVDHYTCPMPEHADVQQDKPGKCPKCGMTLIPVMKPR